MWKNFNTAICVFDFWNFNVWEIYFRNNKSFMCPSSPPRSSLAILLFSSWEFPAQLSVKIWVIGTEKKTVRHPFPYCFSMMIAVKGRRRGSHTMDCSSASSSKFWAKKVRAELGNSVLFDPKNLLHHAYCFIRTLYSRDLLARFSRVLYLHALLARFTRQLYSHAFWFLKRCILHR